MGWQLRREFPRRHWQCLDTSAKRHLPLQGLSHKPLQSLAFNTSEWGTLGKTGSTRHMLDSFRRRSYEPRFLHLPVASKALKSQTHTCSLWLAASFCQNTSLMQAPPSLRSLTSFRAVHQSYPKHCLLQSSPHFDSRKRLRTLKLCFCFFFQLTCRTAKTLPSVSSEQGRSYPSPPIVFEVLRTILLGRILDYFSLFLYPLGSLVTNRRDWL